MEIEENVAYGSVVNMNPTYMEDQIYEPIIDKQKVKLDEMTKDEMPKQPSPLPPNPKKVKIRIFDLLSILALCLALITLLLCVVLLATARQTTPTQQSEDTRAVLSTINDTQLQLGKSLQELQIKADSSHLNFSQTLQEQSLLFQQQISSIMEVQKQLNLSFQSLELQVQSSSRMIQSTEASLSNSTRAIEQFKIALTHTNEQVEAAMANFTNQIRTQITQECVNESMNSDLCNSALTYKLNTLETTVQTLEKSVVLIGSFEKPATSCNDILQNRPSGLYWIQANCTSLPSQVYCDTNPRNFNSTGGWMKVADVDMTDSTQSCPDGFHLINRSEPPLRICGRPNINGCASTVFPVHGIEYSKVCGRIIGYQFGSPSGFYGYNELSQNIDGHYISGASLTHGQSPREHIWSFVNALSDGAVGYKSRVCPCSRSNGNYSGEVPPFVGDDYFCDSATDITANFPEVLYPDDPLWDGHGCDLQSTCCDVEGLPWFCKELPQPTTNDIELRLCDPKKPNLDDSPFEVVEIYIN